MIKVTFEEPTDDSWWAWKEDCETAREELIRQVKAGDRPRVLNLYKDARLTSVYKGAGAPFHGKCAYCESDVGVNQPGDIDHWRPKGALEDKDGRPIMLQSTDSKTGAIVSTKHLGYYWLSYDWSNLLLSCERCNRVVRLNGQRVGKGAQFPVVGFRAVEPGEEAKEHPLLINPMFDDPREHMQIRLRDAMIVPKTERGQATIDIFGLNIREPLVTARLRSIQTTRLLIAYLKVLRSRNGNDEANCIMAGVDKIVAGSVPYSAAGRAALEEWSVL